LGSLFHERWLEIDSCGDTNLIGLERKVVARIVGAVHIVDLETPIFPEFIGEGGTKEDVAITPVFGLIPSRVFPLFVSGG
jgi:hypothetical protein